MRLNEVKCLFFQIIFLKELLCLQSSPIIMQTVTYVLLKGIRNCIILIFHCDVRDRDDVKEVCELRYIDTQTKLF